MERNIYHVGNGQFAIADAAGWLPGVFESRHAAQLAFDVWPKLQALQDEANEKAGGTGGVITLDMLRRS